ncbi:MAG: hypothetical protein MH204_03920, partial [Fimbriimonadaceae bacterium]|nr:hypothetical protein [Fimbriimonadaceae bacterium]
SDTDFLIFDTAAGLDNRVVNFLTLAQEIILVTTPDPTAVTDAYATIKTAKRRVDSPRIRVLVNQTTGEREGEAVFSALQNITKSFLKMDLEWLGTVRQDFQASAALRRRMPFVLTSPQGWAGQDVQAIARKLRQESLSMVRRTA